MAGAGLLILSGMTPAAGAGQGAEVENAGIEEIRWDETPEEGAVRVRFRLEGIDDTFDLPSRDRNGLAQALLFDTPYLQAVLGVDRVSASIRFLFRAEEAENGPWVLSGLDRFEGMHHERAADQVKVGVLDLSHLKGGQWYELVVAWREGEAAAWLNGVRQGDLFPASKGGWKASPDAGRKRAVAGDLLEGPGTEVPVTVEAFELYSAFPNDPTVKQWAEGVPPLVNEGRVRFDDPLDLAGYRKELLHELPPGDPEIVFEGELFDPPREARIREPGPNEWVLEGPGEARLIPSGFELDSRGQGGRTLSATEKKGHLVLWSPWELPETFLLEYDFTPENPTRGLHIIFWNARARDGGSIFDLESGLGFRGGVFSEYTWGRVDSYHASVFATDDDTPRKVANLRKNSGFVLVACGEDAIAGFGEGPHRVRLLKEGNRMEIEANGRKVMVFDDEGRANGPAYHGGAFGFRIMSHTGMAKIENIRLFQLTPEQR